MRKDSASLSAFLAGELVLIESPFKILEMTQLFQHNLKYASYLLYSSFTPLNQKMKLHSQASFLLCTLWIQMKPR